MQIGTLLVFLVVAFGIALGAFHLFKGAGPDWMWRLGRNDPLRNAFFHQDGTWRKFGKTSVVLVIAALVLLAFLGL